MSKSVLFPKYFKAVAIALMLLFVGAACSALGRTPAVTPAVTLVEVNREVTRVVVLEVTRIVEVPVTVTPAPNPTDTPAPAQVSTSTATPTSADTPIPAQVTILIHTECLFGPDPVYLGRYEIQAGSLQTVIGRTQDGIWLNIQGADHKEPCWVKTEQASVNSGNLVTTPVTEPDLSPYSTLYPAPPAVSANRVGNEVTVFWLPVAMTQADYHGYLVEAWVCQAGKQVFIPKSYSTSFDKNDGMLAVKLADEPGCSEPSGARIYTVNNQGYSMWKMILWPASPSPTVTPNP